MNDDDTKPDAEITLESLGAAAANLGGEWHLDAEVPPEVFEPVPEPEPEPAPTPVRRSRPRLFETREQPGVEPPPLERIVEAMLFLGGPPLTPTQACAAIRNFTPTQFQAAIDDLNRKYRAQRRPYLIQPRDGGFVLAILPAYRSLRERLHGGPRETRLSQPALDVLAVIAYQQPVAKADIDAALGANSSSILRQLLRLGLIAMPQRASTDSPDARYTTTQRLLTLFGLRSLDELPRLGDTEPI